MSALPPIQPVWGDKPSKARIMAREGYLMGLSFLLRQRIPNHVPRFSPNFQDRRAPVVFLIPGYLEKPGCFETLYDELFWSGMRVALYQPKYVLASIQEMAADFGRFMDDVLERSTCENCPVYIIGHSMGGLVARTAMLPRWHMHDRVKHIFTLATPHQGTPVAHLGLGDCVEEMLPGSLFLESLNESDTHRRDRISCLIARPDYLLLRSRAARLEGCQEIVFDDSGHMAMLDDIRLVRHISEACRMSTPDYLN